MLERKNMTNLITEARELCRKYNPCTNCPCDDERVCESHFCISREKQITILGLCDALEKGEAELIHYHHLQKVTEGQMKQNQRLRRQLEKAEEKNKQLLHEVCKLACESVERDKALARLEADVMARLEERHEVD